MKINEFYKTYKDPKVKYVVIYSTAFGVQQGTILDAPVLVGKAYKVMIDSYQNPVSMHNVISIKDSGSTW